MGVGLLKPNVSALVASLYPEGGPRRDAGFSIFYMGINLGAFIGSLARAVVSRQWFGWQLGFALPAFGMAVGVAQFCRTRRHLNAAGLPPPRRAARLVDARRDRARARRRRWSRCAAVGDLHSTRCRCRTLRPGRTRSLGLGYFIYLIFFAGLSAAERSRALVMVALFAALGDVLRRLRAAGRLLQPVRRALHRPRTSSAGTMPCRRAAGGEPVLRHHARPGVRLACGSRSGGAARPAGRREVRPRADLHWASGSWSCTSPPCTCSPGRWCCPPGWCATYLLHTSGSCACRRSDCPT